MKITTRLLFIALLLSSCSHSYAEAPNQSEAHPPGQPEASVELLYGLTKAEQDILHHFREQCPFDNGTRLFFDPSRRVVVMDIQYVSSSDLATCLKAVDGKVVVPDMRPINGVELTSGTLPVLDTQDIRTEQTEALIAELQEQRASGPGGIAYARVENDAIRIGVRTMPSRCSQLISMKDDLRESPWIGLPQAAQKIVQKAQADGIPVSFDHEFVDSSWGKCEKGELCDEPPVGC